MNPKAEAMPEQIAAMVQVVKTGMQEILDRMWDQHDAAGLSNVRVDTIGPNEIPGIEAERDKLRSELAAARACVDLLRARTAAHWEPVRQSKHLAKGIVITSRWQPEKDALDNYDKVRSRVGGALGGEGASGEKEKT